MQKENNIMETWNSSTPMDSSMLPSAGDVLARAEKKERQVRHARRTWLGSLAALAVFVLGAGYLTETASSVRLVAGNEKQEYQLPDGTTLWLNRNSELTYSALFNRKARKVKLVGEAYFDVARDEKRPFVVNTGVMGITVHGTRFTVSAYSESAQTAWLEEGSISVKGRGLAQTLLHPDQKVSLNGGEWIVADEVASTHTMWIKDRLVMDNRPLSEIVASLEHWYGTALSMSDPDAAKDIYLSLTVRTEDLDSILESINLISRVKVSR